MRDDISSMLAWASENDPKAFTMVITRLMYWRKALESERRANVMDEVRKRVGKALKNGRDITREELLELLRMA